MITIVLLFLFFSLPQNRYNEIKLQKPFVAFCNLSHYQQDNILEDQALIFDTTTIFLPSEWNEAKITSNKEIDQHLFTELPPQITLYNYKSLSTINHPELSTLSSLDILNKKSINPFSGINQNKPELSQSSLRKAYVTINDFNNFKTIQTYEIDDHDNSIKEPLWIPLKFLVIVDESGSVMPPLLTQSCGIEEIDVFFKNYISKRPVQLNQLPIGYYQIVIGP